MFSYLENWFSGCKFLEYLFFFKAPREPFTCYCVSKEEKYRRGFDEWLRKVFLMVSFLPLGVINNVGNLKNIYNLL